jgi:hypothetical protein
MLIPYKEIITLLNKNNIEINGVLHVGAHDCEELLFYTELLSNTEKSSVVWIEAMESKVKKCKERGIIDIYQAVITDKDDEEVIFHISQNSDCNPDNCESSSILDFGLHEKYHPQVKFIKDIKLRTITIDTFFEKNMLDKKIYDFWNFDIQGAELMALKGSAKYLENFPPKAIYMEVNEQEIYKGCGLLTEIDEFLKKYNFKRVLLKMTEFGWGDALYLRAL